MTTVYANVGHILLKRGNTAQITNYTGPLGELTLNTDTKEIHVHDNVTDSGFAVLASQEYVGNVVTTAITNAQLEGVDLTSYATLTYVDGAIADIPAGPRGPQGNIGPRGPQGIQGNVGAKGDTGDTGPQGIQGNTGPQGTQGIQGNTGPQGIQGNVGATGPQGIQGNVGVGVPTGGTTGQVLAKVNSTDYNTQWVDQTGGGSGSKLQAKKSYNEVWSVPNSTVFSTQIAGYEISIQIADNQDLYLRGLLNRLYNYFDSPSTFYYNYENIRVRINPDTNNILANVTNVVQTNSNPPHYIITVNQAAPGGSLAVDSIRFLYDFYNTAGFDLEDDSFGMATDDDDMIFRSGRDIELLADDDIRIRGGSVFEMTLRRDDDQNLDDGILIRTSDEGDDKDWTFQFDGTLRLPYGGTIGATSNEMAGDTIVITPPNAADGQSLVIRPTAVGALTASGYIVPGQNLTITLTNESGSPDYTGVTYTITGATTQQLGIGSLTGTFSAFSPSGSVPQTTTLVLPIPGNSTATTFTLTVGGSNPWNNTSITVTDNGVIETSHIHLVAGNPTTTDIYLGDDDQYVKIEKDGGDVIIGTDGNTNHWRFGDDGNLDLPDGGEIWFSYGYIDQDTDRDDNALRISGGTGVTIKTDEDGQTWRFNNDGSITFPDDTVQTTAYTGGPGGASLTDEGNVVITAGSTEHWIATQRRNSGNTEPRGLRYDSVGNLYSLTRSYDDADGYPIAVITKYTAAGAVAWQKSFSEVEPLTLAVDSSDRAYIAVQLNAPVVTLVKFSSTGTVLLKKDYDVGPVAIYNAFIEEKSSTTLAMAVTADGGESNFAVVMEVNSTTGVVEIKRQIDLNANVNVTGIDVDPNENVFVTGHYNDSVAEKDKMFIEKLDENLGRVWSKTIDTAGTYDMYGGDCASDALGNIYAVGAFRVDTMNTGPGWTGPQSAGILTKLNSSGVVQWTRRLGPGPCGSFVTGLTATATGNVYLSAVTFVNETRGEFADYPEFIQEAVGANKMIVVRYDTQGAVIWQRYVDVVNLFEGYDDEAGRGQAIAVFGNKFAVDGYGRSSNTTPFSSSDTDDYEDDYFAVQLPTDGTALTIGNIDFVESRVPARLITQATTDSPLANNVWEQTVELVESSVTADAEVRIANATVVSETYEYTFGADGTISVPNDGDLRLTQSQVGYLTAIGGSVNGDNNINSRATTVDSQGNMYVGGEETDGYRAFVTKISPDGDRVWSVTLVDEVDNDVSRLNGIAIDPNTGAVTAVCEVYDNYVYSILLTLDQDTGRVLDNVKFSDTDADVYLNDIAYANLGDSTSTYVLAGSKYGEFSQEFPITKQSGSTPGVIKMLRSDVAGVVPNSWQIGGTGFSVFENVAYVNRYSSLTGTTRQGTGATFDIIDNGNGTYSAGVVGGGTNYLPGHKIKILGTSLGGVTPDNDIIISVQTVGEGGVIQNGGVGNTGTAAGTETATYSGLSGTNYQVGSGFVLDFSGPLIDNNYNNRQSYSVTTAGSDYVENDIIVFDGANFDGVTTTNDLTVRVSVSDGGVAYLHEISGTSQSTIWKISTTTQVDFASTGSWSITYPVSRQNLLITPTWQRTFGTDTDATDRLYAVAVDSGNNVIAVGEGYGELSTGNKYSLAVVYKFNSAGALQWARQLNETNYYCYAKSVTTIGTDIYVTHDSNDNGDTVVTKLDAAGTVKWQRITDSGDDSVIARTANGNILVTAEAYNQDIDDDGLKVFLLTPSGETVYKRWLMATTDNDTRFKNGRCLAVDTDSYYITGYFYANEYNSSLAARLPIDGSGTGEYGSFRYTDVNARTGSFFSGSELTGVNYNIDEVNLAGEYNYAGALTVAPYVNTGTTVIEGTGDFSVDSFYPDFTVEAVRDTDGGNIIFADGTKQNTSATDIPQRRYTGQRYTLGLKDRGHHILCNTTDDTIVIPYNARVEFPTGTVITFVNNTGGLVYISQEGSSINLILAGEGSDVGGVFLQNYGIATLLNIGVDQWIISGNLTTSP